jgi:hypothetical protein
VLQEEILSKCHLIFTPHEIQWKCKTKALSETLPYDNDIGWDRVESYEKMALSTMGAIRLIVSDPSLFKTMGTNRLLRSHFRIWYKLVELYSARNLTITSDKLPAISGIARLMHRGFRCEFGAGLWKEDLLKGLCWYVEAESTPWANDGKYSIAVMPQDNHAPSWSWAISTDRRIKFFATAIQDAEEFNLNLASNGPAKGFQVLDWTFKYMSGAATPFGHVKSGSLTVKGHMKMAFLIPAFEEEQAVGKEFDWRPLWKAHAIDLISKFKIGEVALDQAYEDFTTQYKSAIVTESGSTREGLLVFYVPIEVTDFAYLIGNDQRRHTIALVLLPHNSTKQEYRRVGLLYRAERGSNPNEQDSCMDDFEQLLDDVYQPLDDAYQLHNDVFQLHNRNITTPEATQEDDRQTIYIV